MRKDLTPYYRALGLNPGAEAVEIRAAYRQMMQQWHPDLFKAGSPMQVTAEDITKEINDAYDQLYRKKLYKNFSPKSERKDETSPKARSSSASAAPKEEARERAKRPAPSKTRPPKRAQKIHPAWWKSPRTRRWARRATALGAICAFVFCIRAVGKWMGSVSWASTGSVVQSAAQPQPASFAPLVASGGPVAENMPPQTMRVVPTTLREDVRDKSLPKPRAVVVAASTGPLPSDAVAGMGALRPIDRASTLLDVIELGDTKAKVLSVQGNPDEVGDSVIRYGSSVVYFRNGIVSGWLDRFPRLHVRDQADLSLPSLDTFALGGSRGDVVRAQGLPASFSDSSYTYGTSMVFFEGDRVTGWADGDVQLRGFEMPSLDFFELDRVTGSRGFSGF
jgi:hypothetical protein